MRVTVTVCPFGKKLAGRSKNYVAMVNQVDTEEDLVEVKYLKQTTEIAFMFPEKEEVFWECLWNVQVLQPQPLCDQRERIVFNYNPLV